MILLGTPIPAHEAHAAGLVAELVDDGKVLEETVAVATKLAASSGTALSLAKQAICHGGCSHLSFSIASICRQLTYAP